MMLIGKETGVYTEDLIMPILTCLSDADSRVRYYACESLYNVVKVRREYNKRWGRGGNKNTTFSGF